MDCPSCGTQADPAATPTCPVCGWAFAPASAAPSPPTIQPATRPKIPVEVILGLGIDITGSSQPFADGIRGNIDALLQAIEAKAASVRVTVQSHGDEDDRQQPTLVADGVPVVDAITAVKALIFDGGGDPAEHHLNAIEQLANTMTVVPGGGRQRGALVFFTTADSKPARSGKTATQIGADLRCRGLIVCMVGEAGTCIEAVASASQGFFFRIDANPNPDEMRRVAAQIAASIVATLTKGTTRPMTQPLGTV